MIWFLFLCRQTIWSNLFGDWPTFNRMGKCAFPLHLIGNENKIVQFVMKFFLLLLAISIFILILRCHQSVSMSTFTRISFLFFVGIVKSSFYQMQTSFKAKLGTESSQNNPVETDVESEKSEQRIIWQSKYLIIVNCWWTQTFFSLAALSGIVNLASDKSKQQRKKKKSEKHTTKTTLLWISILYATSNSSRRAGLVCDRNKFSHHIQRNLSPVKLNELRKRERKKRKKQRRENTKIHTHTRHTLNK